MSTPYRGRHTGGVHRTPTVGRARASQSAQVFSQALRRPLVSVAAIVAVAGVSAAGFASEVKPRISHASFTASPMAVAQAAELSQNRNDTNAALVAARRSGVQRSSALTHQKKAAAVALVQARVEAAAALVQARQAAAERAAREQQRVGILARAQSNPRAVARLLVADRGWADTQFGCLDSLWAKESGWSWQANNSGSGAFGIPQALPGSKMASVGSDWDTNPITQIKWGLSYISNRYGTPCSAWAQSQSVNWY